MSDEAQAEGAKFAPLLICVTGSIAASGIVPLVQLLVERDRFAHVQIVLSQAAARFVRPEPLAILTGRSCVTDLFDAARDGQAAHIKVARAADVALVVPATANIMAKLAHGIADDTVSTVMSVFEGARILVPAAHPVTARQASFGRNMEQLREDGFLMCGPVAGYSMSENRRAPDVGGIPRPEIVAAFVEYVAETGEAPDIWFDTGAEGQ